MHSNIIHLIVFEYIKIYGGPHLIKNEETHKF